jgi:hypothetical protein
LAEDVDQVVGRHEIRRQEGEQQDYADEDREYSEVPHYLAHIGSLFGQSIRFHHGLLAQLLAA